MPATLYTKSNCVQCDATKRMFKASGIEYSELDAIENLDYLKGLGHLQAPVVVTDSGQHWSGFQPDKIKEIINE